MTGSGKSSKLSDQGIVADSNVDRHMVTSTNLDEYHKYYEIPESLELILPEGRTH